MTAPDLDEEVIHRLRRGNHRYSRGRRRIVAVLAAGEGPMTIPQILAADPELAQSSAYRNLAVLAEVGVVARIVTADDFTHYELAEDLTEHHHHLICSECGDVSDFSLAPAVESQLERALGRVGRRTGFQVDHHRLDLVGRCGACR